MAYHGEIGQGFLPLPDVALTDEWWAGQALEAQDGVTLESIAKGFVGAEDTERGLHIVGRRVDGLTFADANALLYGRRVMSWKRPAETDYARIMAFAAAYLPGTVDTTWVLNANTINLPKRTYTTDNILTELITDFQDRTDKTIFIVTEPDGTQALHYHRLNEGETAGIEISDVDPARFAQVTVFAPGDPKRMKDPSELGNDITVRNSSGATANQTDATSITRHDAGGVKHQRLVDAVDATGAELAAMALRLVQEDRNEKLSFACTIGPMTWTQVKLIPVGSLVTITSQVWKQTAGVHRVAAMTIRHTKLRTKYWLDLELGYPFLRGRGARRPLEPTEGGMIVKSDDLITSDGFGADARRGSFAVANDNGGGVGSHVYYNQAYTVTGCPIGGGRWIGIHMGEMWAEFTVLAAAGNEDVVGLWVTSPSAANWAAPPDGGPHLGKLSLLFYPGHRPDTGDPDIEQARYLRKGLRLAAVPLSGTTPDQVKLFVPRSMLTMGADASFKISPDWVVGSVPGPYTLDLDVPWATWNEYPAMCNEAAEFCNPLTPDIGCSVRGFAGSGQYAYSHPKPNDWLLEWATLSPGEYTADWVGAIGEADGANRSFTLYSWTGTGTVEARVNGVDVPPGEITLDAGSGVVVLNDAPPLRASVLFRYRASV